MIGMTITLSYNILVAKSGQTITGRTGSINSQSETVFFSLVMFFFCLLFFFMLFGVDFFTSLTFQN